MNGERLKVLPENQYVEVREDGYYLAGTRVGLDVLVYEFRDGRTADAIFEAYPSIGSLAKVYGAITFILEHPSEIETYLKRQDERYEEIQRRHPLPSELIDRFEQRKKELISKHG